MKLFRFDPDVGKNIVAFESLGVVISRIAYFSNEAVISCAYLEANGVIGYHQAIIPQLFIVVQGEGWVRDEKSKKTFIKTGQAAYWDKDEWHESGTEGGMTAIIVEGTTIDLSKLMPAV